MDIYVFFTGTLLGVVIWFVADSLERYVRSNSKEG